MRSLRADNIDSRKTATLLHTIRVGGLGPTSSSSIGSGQTLSGGQISGMTVNSGKFRRKRFPEPPPSLTTCTLLLHPADPYRALNAYRIDVISALGGVEGILEHSLFKGTA